LDRQHMLVVMTRPAALAPGDLLVFVGGIQGGAPVQGFATVSETDSSLVTVEYESGLDSGSFNLWSLCGISSLDPVTVAWHSNHATVMNSRSI